MYNGTFLLPPCPALCQRPVPFRKIHNMHTTVRVLALSCAPTAEPPSVTTLANFCFLEVSLPRAKGIIFFPFSFPLCLSALRLLLRIFLTKIWQLREGEECCGTELGKFLLSLLECFAFWFFRLRQTCSRKPSRASLPPYLSVSLFLSACLYFCFTHEIMLKNFSVFNIHCFIDQILS